jgi:hypothetical protein
MLFLVERLAQKYVRADWSGLIRQEFLGKAPKKRIPPHVRAWLESRT